ncbi:MAG: hypothetical protein LUH58_08590 [Lachnospiraceae bacterium]|nr:hypothetical protein [Lachnospiraceae bacterium]
MRRQKPQMESGSVEVEATFILPIAIICVMFLLQLSLLLFQRANLQACLETCLVYYKNSVTDTYVTRNTEVEYATAESTTTGSGNSYVITGPLNPYASLDSPSGIEDQDAFQKYFESIAGKMIFGGEVTVTLDYTNYLLIKEYEATATQSVTLPIDFSLIGLGRNYKITATARAVVSDHDDIIRTVDYVIDLVEDTRVGEFFSGLSEKVSNAYGTMKTKLGIS